MHVTKSMDNKQMLCHRKNGAQTRLTYDNICNRHAKMGKGTKNTIDISKVNLTMLKRYISPLPIN